MYEKVTYSADFVEGNANRHNRYYENTRGVVNVIIHCPNHATKDLKKIERVEHFIYKQTPVGLDVDRHRIEAV